ncbi:MAG: glutamyl-tRNA reductase [Flavobacteriales bacterium]|nr:glutamyl-tRNA reductase [Flavobacteriales bacterium]
MKNFYSITFTHQSVGLEGIGQYHVLPENFDVQTISAIKMECDEFLFLSTCNRVEYWLTAKSELSRNGLLAIFQHIYKNRSAEFHENAVNQAIIYSQVKAVEHVFRVASSLDSLVIGEREILSQIRDAFSSSKQLDLTGDFLRILVRKTVDTAKKVFTQTEIADKPVSVVNLAYRKLMDLNPKKGSRILVVGSGRTNQALTKKMKKNGFSNFTVFNRSIENAQSLASELNGNGNSLEQLCNHQNGFDILVACTASQTPIITHQIFKDLLGGENGREKIVVDLAMPREVDEEIIESFKSHFIGVESLKEIAAENLKSRKSEIHKCEAIVEAQIADFIHVNKVRQVELAMRQVPLQMREIRQRAFETVFAADVQKLDSEAKEVLEKVVSYMEKKYMNAPMLMAKEILIKEDVR